MQVTQSRDTYNPETFVDFLYPDEHDFHTGRPQYRTKIVRDSERALLENLVNNFQATYGLFWVGTFNRFELESILDKNDIADIHVESFSARKMLDFLNRYDIQDNFFFGREYSEVLYIDLPGNIAREMARQLNADEINYLEGIGMYRLWWD